MRHRLLRTMVVWGMMALCLFGLPAAGQSVKNVLIIDIPRLTFSDITSDYPVLNRLLMESAAGVMVLPNVDLKTADKAYLELNSGNPLKTSPDATAFFQVDEKYKGMAAGHLYRTLTGTEPPAEGGVNLGFSKLVQLNLSNKANQSLGLVGKLLHQKGYRTVVAGNADTDRESFNRQGTALLMDERGTVDRAFIGWETVDEDLNFVFGLKTATSYLLDVWERFSSEAAVTHLILGDLERINKFSSYLPAPRLEYHRNQVLRHYEEFFKALLPRIDFNRTLLVVLSVAGPDYAKTGARLNPVIIKSEGFSGGKLYSNSTRRPGLATGYDVVATILRHVGISDKAGYFKGRPLRAVEGGWQEIASMQQDLAVNYDLRWPLLSVYGYGLIALAVAFTIGFLGFRKRDAFFKWLLRIYLFFLTFPVVFLAEALFRPTDWSTIVGFTVIAGAGLTALAYKAAKGDSGAALWCISALTVAGIIIDGLWNGYTQLYSFWGYSAVAGARFYGIGNEYMGFLLGAYIVMVTLGWERVPTRWRKAVWPAGMLLALLIAHPALGANIGGGVTALLGLGIANYLWLNRPVGIRQLTVLAVVFSLFISIIALSDLAMDGKVTHFGQFLKAFQEEGLPALMQLFSRKLSMNLQLMGYTPLSNVLIGILLLIPVLYKKPPRVVAGWFARHPQGSRGLLGLSLTALIALIANDSGIVSVATMFIFGAPLLMVLMLEKTSLRS